VASELSKKQTGWQYFDADTFHSPEVLVTVYILMLPLTININKEYQKDEQWNPSN
jgi:hypothetical protein